MERFKIRAFAIVPGHIAVFASEKIQEFLDESYPDIESFVRPIVASNRIEVVLSFEADDFVAAEKMGNSVLGGVFSAAESIVSEQIHESSRMLSLAV
ncbi:MAG: hypothetical protein Q4D85_09260 [Corynebacterium sp.]|uniref:hypothetical protein n=1 Tax=Corynebacterium sp. TaxID=1720 RepID=UPI0026DD1E95|nr:hypothetical protein [Corynebacterium sp.]MDO5098936.1 hypothetical protein [Corynebacterium sp.]